MNDTGSDHPETARWDPGITERVIGILRPLAKRYFRSEVLGLENVPSAGGMLVVSNHSGGMFAMDVPIFAIDYYAKFGYGRPVYTLSHDMILKGPTADFFARTGFIKANPENAAEALRSGGLVVVFPGGGYDAYRPTVSENVIDFGGRTGYVRTAIAAGVPIVPMVSIGGQQTQLFLSRGTWLAKRLTPRLGPVARATRAVILPISIGFPFGLSVLIPPNIPLPAKIVTQVLEPIDIGAEFGKNPDAAAVDARVREVMQRGIDRLGSNRRLPILG